MYGGPSSPDGMAAGGSQPHAGDWEAGGRGHTLGLSHSRVCGAQGALAQQECSQRIPCANATTANKSHHEAGKVCSPTLSPCPPPSLRTTLLPVGGFPSGTFPTDLLSPPLLYTKNAIMPFALCPTSVGVVFNGCGFHHINTQFPSFCYIIFHTMGVL